MKNYSEINEIVFEFIGEHKSRHGGNSPSYREIMEGCGLRSLSEIYPILRQLAKQNRIKLGNVARSIELTAK